MENQAENNYNWVIKDFSSLSDKTIFSNRFVIGNCKWRLQVNPQGENSNKCLSLYLSVTNAKHLGSGWSRYAKFSLTIINQAKELSHRLEAEKRFDQNSYVCGFSNMILLTKLHAKNGGFLVNGELEIVVEINILKVIGKLDVPQESEEANQPLKRIKLAGNDGLPAHSLDKTPSVKQTIDVRGFQVLPSQAALVNHIFRKHPDTAEGVIFKNEHMKTASMNFLLSIIETLHKSLEELTDEDLVEADNALAMVKSSGFKVDWLEKKLEGVKVNKKEHQRSQAWIKKVEAALKYYKQWCIDMEDLLEKEREKEKARTSLTSDDVV